MSSSKKQIVKPRPISGFPEWSPAVRHVEQQWLDHIRRVFESYGFCSIETPSVEALEVLAAKGEVDKEIYVLERLHKEEGEEDEARLALHFDQTVPLARYTAQHFNDLIFPFKRYQMQRVWRGERPQAGRFREFRQCDIDVIAVDNLPLHFDAEIPAIIWEVLSGLPGMAGESIQIRVSNRKIWLGFLDGLGVDEEGKAEVLRQIDKLEKVGADVVRDELRAFGIEKAEQILALAETKTSHSSALLGLKTEGCAALMQEGIDELAFVLDQLQHLPEGAVVADLSIVRGLDYYTGTVYETVFTDDPGYGSICSGGRYDDLAGSYINKHLPGVGISIGFSRLFARLLAQDKLPVGSSSPAHVLMVLPSEERRAAAAKTAHVLRERGINVELYHAPQKIGKQIVCAEKKGIPYVWFPPFEEGGDHEVKNLGTGEQVPAEPDNWNVS